MKISKPKCDVMYEVSQYMLFNIYEICVTLRVSNIIEWYQSECTRMLRLKEYSNLCKAGKR